MIAEECILCPSISVLLSSVAVTFAVPLALAVSTPSASTATMFVLSEVQFTPFKSSSDALVFSCTVSPTAVYKSPFVIPNLTITLTESPNLAANSAGVRSANAVFE